MPEIVQCPHCDKKLRVSDDLLGKAVKCPGCGDQFVAKAVAAPPPDAMQKGPAARPARDADTEEEQEDRPARRRRGRDDEDEDDRPRRPRAGDDEDEDDRPRRPRAGDDDDEDEDDRPRRRRGRDDDDEDDRPRRRGRKGKASVSGMGPGIAFLIIGIMGLMMGGVYVIQAIMGRPFLATANQAAQYPAFVLWLIALISLIWGAVVMLGGVKFMRLESWGSAMTACIFAMLPCNPCCLAGLPIGIWGLIVLLQDDVKNAFR